MSKLESLIDRKRNNTILAHDIRNELAILKKLEFDLNTGISATIDTQQIMQHVSFTTGSRSARSPIKLLTTLGIEFENLHVGGNDANFTMKALVLQF